MGVSDPGACMNVWGAASCTCCHCAQNSRGSSRLPAAATSAASPGTSCMSFLWPQGMLNKLFQFSVVCFAGNSGKKATLLKEQPSMHMAIMSSQRPKCINKLKAVQLLSYRAGHCFTLNAFCGLV